MARNSSRQWRGVVQALVVATVAGAAPAQQPDPQAGTVVLQFELDGVPMPGVPLRREPAVPTWPRADGWLRPDAATLASAAWPVVGRSDPGGQLVVTANDGIVDWAHNAVGAPFGLVGVDHTQGGLRVRVARREQFVVRVLDPDGVPLPDMPMALQQDGRDITFAFTDAKGLATFGVDPRFAARCRVVPFGWIGPVDDLPTVALQFVDRIFDMRLPPFGRVRVRALDRGIPRAVQIDAVRLVGGATISPTEPAQWDNRAFGAEFGPVALGVGVAGSIRFPAGEARFETPVVQKHGDVVVFDVESDPPRPRLVLHLVAPGLRAAEPGIGVGASFTIVTDAGATTVLRAPGKSGIVTLDPGADQLRGRRLLRIDVDVVESAPQAAAGKPLTLRQQAWSGTLAVDRELTPTRTDLGAVELTPRGAVLRGRVVDEGGAAFPGTSVQITAAGAAGGGMAVGTQDDGAFELWQPLLRDEHGAPARIVAQAVWSLGHEVVMGEPSEPLDPGSEVTLVVRRPARGFVEVDFANGPAVPMAALDFAFVDAAGTVQVVDVQRRSWTRDASTHGVPRCRIGPLPAGKGTLRILLRPGVRLLEVADVVVAADGKVIADPRLRGVDLTPFVRNARMRVLDEQGVPIAGARVEYRGVSDTWGIGPSDGGGWLELVDGATDALRLVVTAPGKQPFVLARVVEGGDITLQPMPSLCVVVKGLPDDLPRDGFAVFLRSVVRENLGDYSEGALGAGDTATMNLPPPGRYHVRLTRQRRNGTGSSWTTLVERETDALVGEHGDSLEFVLDAAAVQRIRDAQKE